MFPPMSTDGVVAAAFIPLDGYLDPSQLTFALADGARLRGADIEQRTKVTGINLRDGRVHEVVTDKGTIRTDVVVNAGGMYAPQIARMVGVTVPIITYGHEFLVTEAFQPALAPLPTLRDPDRLIYFRTEVGGLIMGGYERNPAPWALDGVPDGFEAQLLPEDWPRFEPLLGAAVERVPDMETAEVRKLYNGPEAFTPDGEFILGESACPGSGSRPGSAPTAWPAPAGWAGRWPSGSCTASPASTCGTWTAAASAASTAAATTRSRGRPRSTRPTTTSSTPTTSAPPAGRCGSRRRTRAWPSSARASARSPAGSGRTGSSRTRRSATRRLRPRGWAGQNWSPAIHAEAIATRERAGLFDETSFAKIEVSGPGAAAYLQRLCANDVDRAVGSVTYTQMLNSRGGIECDFTVTRLAERRFRIVTGTAFGNHDLGWIRRHMPARRLGRRGRRHLGLRLPGAVGAARPRHPPAADDGRPLERRPAVHAHGRDRRRPYPLPRRPRHLRRRAGLGALLPVRVRRRAVGRDLGVGLGPRHARRRLPRDRRAARREGLPGVGRRHHPRGHARRGRPGLRGQARQGRRVHRPRRPPAGPRGARRAGGSPAWPWPIRPRSPWARSRCGSAARWPGG